MSATSAAALAVGLVVTGALPRSEAAAAAAMLAFLTYLAAALWAFAERRTLRVWLVFASVVVVSLAIVAAATPTLVDMSQGAG